MYLITMQSFFGDHSATSADIEGAMAVQKI